MPISPARKIACEVLRSVEAESAYASDLLHARLDASVRTEDAALATELTFGVLRWRRLLDFLLAPHLKRPPEKLDLPVALSLRMGLYQLRFLERIPARAAVNESVELVKRAGKSSAAPLVNAVLRHASEEAAKPAEEFLPAKTPSIERLGILHSHPTWLVERWHARLGEKRAVALMEANNRTPRLSCSIPDAPRREEVLRALEAAGLGVESGGLLKTACSVSGGSVARTEAFRKGWIEIQDEASQAVPLLLDVHAGDRVLDLCAAPGGKSPTLVRGAGPGGRVVAADRHAHRLRAARARFERLGLGRVPLLELDAAVALPFRVLFDRILVDAPCSGSGTLGRHPEIRWRLKPEQLAEFHGLQKAILANALAQLGPGARLVYSTCSLESEENETVVAEALRDDPSIRRVPVSEALHGLALHLADGVDPLALFDGAGDFRTFPGQRPTDGFFAAVMQKK